MLNLKNADMILTKQQIIKIAEKGYSNMEQSYFNDAINYVVSRHPHNEDSVLDHLYYFFEEKDGDDFEAACFGTFEDNY